MIKADYGISLYTQTGAYAREHDELDSYRASLQANAACRDAIESAISENYRNNSLSDAGAKTVLAQYSAERIQYVLAATIRQKEYDGRISRDNREWARTIFVCPKNREYFVVNKTHSGLLDIFTCQIRQEISLAQQIQQEQNAVPLVDENTNGLKVLGHIGTWHTIGRTEVMGQPFFLMEHDEFGDEAAAIIVDSQGALILEDIWNGFDSSVMEQLQEAAFPDESSLREQEAIFSGYPLPSDDPKDDYPESANRLGRR